MNHYRVQVVAALDVYVDVVTDSEEKARNVALSQAQDCYHILENADLRVAQVTVVNSTEKTT